MSVALSEWGLAGIDALRERVAVLVVVDILSFSTAVDVAVARGAIVYPFPDEEPAAAQVAADRIGATLARPRDVASGQPSLSPVSLITVPAGMRLMLPSPNGARLSLACGGTPVLTGCLRNAAAVAKAARRIAGSGAIGVVPAGERWPDGSLRPAIEDLLGAGSIRDQLDATSSPEAQVARDAYRAAGRDVANLIRGSVSGRELIDRRFSGDVELALEPNVSANAPILIEGAYRAA